MDPRGAEHSIELFTCAKKKVKVVDDEGDPVSGATFALQLATKPNYSYFGIPEEAQVTTDESGIATYNWYPNLNDLHCYAQFAKQEWAAAKTTVGSDEIVVIARKRERKTVSGSVSFEGDAKFPGGFPIELHSFQDVIDNHSDLEFVTTDQHGNFSADVLVDATYCVWLKDERWVSKPLALIPYQSVSGKITNPKLTIVRGQKVDVRVKSASSNRPIPNAEVRFHSRHSFSWREDGRDQSGTSGPRSIKTTGDQGQAIFYTFPGELRVSAQGDGWRIQETIEVSADEPNEVTLLRKDIATKVTGKLLAPDGVEVDLADAEIEIRAIDGESGDEFELQTQSDGTFEFKTSARTLGLFVYSADRQFSGTKIIKDTTLPVEVELHVTKPFDGQILDEAGQPVAGHIVWTWVQRSTNASSAQPIRRRSTGR